MKFLANKTIFRTFYVQSAVIKPCQMYFMLTFLTDDICRPTDDFNGTCSQLQIPFLKTLIPKDRDFYFAKF